MRRSSSVLIVGLAGVRGERGDRRSTGAGNGRLVRGRDAVGQLVRRAARRPADDRCPASPRRADRAAPARVLPGARRRARERARPGAPARGLSPPPREPPRPLRRQAAAPRDRALHVRALRIAKRAAAARRCLRRARTAGSTSSAGSAGTRPRCSGTGFPGQTMPAISELRVGDGRRSLVGVLGHRGLAERDADRRPLPPPATSRARGRLVRARRDRELWRGPVPGTSTPRTSSGQLRSFALLGADDMGPVARLRRGLGARRDPPRRFRTPDRGRRRRIDDHAEHPLGHSARTRSSSGTPRPVRRPTPPRDSADTASTRATRSGTASGTHRAPATTSACAARWKRRRRAEGRRSSASTTARGRSAA